MDVAGQARPECNRKLALEELDGGISVGGKAY